MHPRTLSVARRSRRFPRLAPSVVVAVAAAAIVAASLTHVSGPPSFSARAEPSLGTTSSSVHIVDGARTWGPVDGDREFTQNLVIPVGGTLTILPGTTLRFAEGAGIIVGGTLELAGTATNTVVLSGIAGDSWAGVDVLRSGKLIRGETTILDAPEVSTLSAHTAAIAESAATTPACADVLFLGLMGSGEHHEVGNHDLLGAKVRGMYDGLRAGLQAAESTRHLTVAKRGLSYAANPVPFLGTPEASLGENLSSVREFVPGAWDGATALIAALQDQQRVCPSQELVIGGYSQGAWAIHAALSYLAASGSDLLHPISAIGLIADPLRSATVALPASALSAGVGDGIATTGLAAAALSYAQWNQSAAIESNPLLPNVQMNSVEYPRSLHSITRELCATGDVICDTARTLEGTNSASLLDRIIAGSDVHNGYQPKATGQLGKDLARQLIDTRR